MLMWLFAAGMIECRMDLIQIPFRNFKFRTGEIKFAPVGYGIAYGMRAKPFVDGLGLEGPEITLIYPRLPP